MRAYRECPDKRQKETVLLYLCVLTPLSCFLQHQCSSQVTTIDGEPIILNVYHAKLIDL